MFPESKVTEIYCMADDFCKEFTLQQEKYMVEDKEHKHRNKPNRMNDADLFCFIRVVSDVSSITTRSMSASIRHTCFPNVCPTTASWNWKKRCCFH